MDDFQLIAAQLDLIQRPFHGRIFLEGPAGAGKTSAAVLRLLEMLHQGIPGDSILLLTPQRALAAPYETLLHSPQAGAGGRVTTWTPGGLALRMVELFWPLAAGPAGFSSPDALPVFLNLETAQYYMAYLVRPMLEDQRLFDSVILDRNRLYSQILDNLNKAALVGFPYTQIGERLKSAWMGEPGQLRVYEDVQTCATLFRQFCLQHNLLDFSLQVEVFRDYLWSAPEVRDYLQNTFRHLIADNIEEDSPFAHDLLREWLPALDSALLIYDTQAGYRRFLGADPHTAAALAAVCEQNLEFGESLVNSAEMAHLAESLEQSLQGARLAPPEMILPPGDDTRPEALQIAELGEAAIYQAPRQGLPGLYYSYHRFYPQMLDWVAQSVNSLIHEQGVLPGEIVILAPILTDALRFSLMDRLGAHRIPYRSHRPSRSLREEPANQCLLTLAALAHPEWGVEPTRYDVAYALVLAIEGMDLVRAQLLSEIVYRPRRSEFPLLPFDPIRAEVQERITYRLGERYEQLRQWLEASRAQEDPLDYFLSRLFGEVLSTSGFGFHTSYDAGQATANLIDSVRNFRWVVGPVLDAAGVPLGREYLSMVQDGVIAAQYVANWQLQPGDAVMLAPAYTFLLSNRPVRVQFWLDVGSRGWSERLYQPLTHPYVLAREWEFGRVWTDMDELAAGREAMTRVAGGLLRRCREALYLGLSELNEQGFEQRGPLLMAFQRLLRERPAAQE
jgi:hypothetical protein